VTFLYRDRPRGAAIAAPSREPRAFHHALDGHAPTPLVAQPRLAADLGVARVDLKLETNRLGLPSFKVMGASWATIAALGPVLPRSWAPHDGLATLAGALPALTLVAATEGNHGRALARIARLLGVWARIFVSDDVAEARVTPIAAEGAEVVRVAGSYDDAVARSAADAEQEGHVLVSDTSWPGYERVPAAVVDGYSTILWEVSEQLADAGREVPDLVLVQLGVGSFGAAVIRHFRQAGGDAPRIVGVEPAQAACVMASLAAGGLVTVPGPHASVMAGLNCDTPSLVAWPVLRDGLDGVIALSDEQALEGVATLAAEGIAVGECSGVAIAAARELLAGPDAELHRTRLRVGRESSVLLFATEGVTQAS
jgi:diaminopropionate ammonia-lyase